MRAVQSNPDEVEQRIATVLDDLIENPESMTWTTTEWTSRLKSAVGEIGRASMYWVYAHGCSQSHGGEFLVDLCWLEYDDKALVGVPLVMECEWGPKDVDDDFQKLVMLRADHRVMVFRVPTGKERDGAFGELLQHVNANRHAISGDRYLLSCWRSDNRGFEHRAYEVVDGTG